MLSCVCQNLNLVVTSCAFLLVTGREVTALKITHAQHTSKMSGVFLSRNCFVVVFRWCAHDQRPKYHDKKTPNMASSCSTRKHYQAQIWCHHGNLGRSLQPSIETEKVKENSFSSPWTCRPTHFYTCKWFAWTADFRMSLNTHFFNGLLRLSLKLLLNPTKKKCFYQKWSL